MALRPTHLLPPKRPSTPRSDRRLSATDRGLLPGFPALTRVGLAPTGLVQLSGRNMACMVEERPVQRSVGPAQPPSRADASSAASSNDGSPVRAWLRNAASVNLMACSSPEDTARSTSSSAEGTASTSVSGGCRSRA